MNAEQQRLTDPAWRKWGPYLSERQWGTVREDYSPDGHAWEYFPHDHARSRVYRWGEDGIAGISDSRQRLCFAIALWNGNDPILKERLFGLSGPEGNHGEDVKELYYYLDNTPSHSYMKHLYKYPQAAYPYDDLVDTNAARDRSQPEYELLDTGIFNNNKYFDVVTEYAKQDTEDILVRITIYNRADAAAPLTVLPTLWLRNLWTFGYMQAKPQLQLKQREDGTQYVKISHETLGDHWLYFEAAEQHLFTENETNTERIFNRPNASPFVKDALHDAVIKNDFSLFDNKTEGTKFSPMYRITVAPGQPVSVRLRLTSQPLNGDPFGEQFDEIFGKRLQEANTFYDGIALTKDADLRNIQRQAFAGLLWNKQYYNIDMIRWLHGDPTQSAPPESRLTGRNSDWTTLINEDIISMPDKWEYPWYAAWDLAFHCVTLSMIDAALAKKQLILLLREWYMDPKGQLPAYEWSFNDVNPPVHAWSCLHVYKTEKSQTGKGDIGFLKKVFSKLLINFTWWVNQKDFKGDNVFQGGFLGLDNIGVFDRSRPVPGGGKLEQADGTSWMAMYCLNMLEMALEIAQEDDSYEDVTTKFLEHFVYISESINKLGESWDDSEGFFYDVVKMPDGREIPVKVRSLVGLTTLFAVMVLKKEMLEKLPDFYKRLKWFQHYRESNKQYQVMEPVNASEDILLSLLPKERLQKIMEALLNEDEFLSPGGIRSVSKIHKDGYHITIDGQELGLQYQPAESTTDLYGGNSNWRGPVWMPMNYLIVLSLHAYSEYHKLDCCVDFPSHSGNNLPLNKVSIELCKRLIGIFKKDKTGKRKIFGNQPVYQSDPHFSNLLQFYEYYNGDNAEGLGASHQTGWTSLVAALINRLEENHTPGETLSSAGVVPMPEK